MTSAAPGGATSERQLKIAQITPLYEAVPPKLYGGTERVVAHLSDALVQAGHDVTALVRPGTSITMSSIQQSM